MDLQPHRVLSLSLELHPSGAVLSDRDRSRSGRGSDDASARVIMKRIQVSIATQRLELWEGSRLVKSWPCSTSSYGIGSQEGSNKTPVGSFTVREKHGDGAPSGTIFKSRQA